MHEYERELLDRVLAYCLRDLVDEHLGGSMGVTGLTGVD